MASIAKRVKTRTSRCIDDLMALAPTVAGDDLMKLNASIRIIRDAEVTIATVMHANRTEQPAPARPQMPEIVRATPPQARPSIVPATAQPPRALPPIQESEWPRVQHAIDQVLRGDLELSDVYVPRDSEDGEYVDFCLADMATAYDNAAAQLLAKDKAAWALMDGQERRKAVKAKAEQIEADDDGTDTYLQFLVHGVSF